MDKTKNDINERHELLYLHYIDQPKYGHNVDLDAIFHKNQTRRSRFKDNPSALTTYEMKALTTKPDDFLSTYYNSTNLGVVRAFEGPNPLSYHSDHVWRFIYSLVVNAITALVGAGNPLHGLIARDVEDGSLLLDKNGEPQLGELGFFDITSIPRGYLDPNKIWKDADILRVKNEYISKLRENAEIKALDAIGYNKEIVDQLLYILASEYFSTLEKLREYGIHIEAIKSENSQPGSESYLIEINWSDGLGKPINRTIRYLSLSHWENFDESVFTSVRLNQLCQFYEENKKKIIGVSCVTGLGKSGVLALAFDLLNNFDNYFDHDSGMPYIAKIDERLQSMRTLRPGLIQSPQQYTLAISLANQMHQVINKQLGLDDNKLKSMHKKIEDAIVAYQAQLGQQKKRVPKLASLNIKNKTDYTKDINFKNGTSIAICEVNGNDPERKQEDAVAYDSGSASKLFSGLSFANQKKVMTTTFASLQENIRGDEAGSCACVATGWIANKNKVNVSTSYLGDSVSFLIVIDRNGKIKRAQACNPDLHDCNNINEVREITEGTGIRGRGFIEDDRLNGMLSPTRAFGDNQFNGYGISHEPEMIKIEYSIETGDRVFMVMGCDGMMEHLKGEYVAYKCAKQIGDIFANNASASSVELAEMLVDNALAGKGGSRKSRDNITVIVVRLLPGKNPVTIAVFDGHGGNIVSKQLGQDFTTHFSKALTNLPTAQSSRQRHDQVKQNESLNVKKAGKNRLQKTDKS